MQCKLVGTILLVCLPLAAFSQTCVDVLNEFRAMPKSQPLSQLYFPRYKSILGQERQIDTFTQQWYSWGSFKVLVRDGRTIRTEGYRPLGIREYPTVNELIYLLRYPVVGPVEELKRYTWGCGGENPGNVLRITVDAGNNIVGYDGIFCDPINKTDCANFSSENSLVTIQNPQ